MGDKRRISRLLEIGSNDFSYMCILIGQQNFIRQILLENFKISKWVHRQPKKNLDFVSLLEIFRYKPMKDTLWRVFLMN